ncbi:hypothetical protein PLICRDRAFT_235131 [Plicaturopsis crispa FD-325 SS-3]|nr:hypothetical protein PLICRDRAFT_235131 [Plicaturopsis crispa FD-325 SS-3]
MSGARARVSTEPIRTTGNSFAQALYASSLRKDVSSEAETNVQPPPTSGDGDGHAPTDTSARRRSVVSPTSSKPLTAPATPRALSTRAAPPASLALDGISRSSATATFYKSSVVPQNPRSPPAQGARTSVDYSARPSSLHESTAPARIRAPSAPSATNERPANNRLAYHGSQSYQIPPAPPHEATPRRSTTSAGTAPPRNISTVASPSSGYGSPSSGSRMGAENVGRQVPSHSHASQYPSARYQDSHSSAYAQSLASSPTSPVAPHPSPPMSTPMASQSPNYSVAPLAPARPRQSTSIDTVLTGLATGASAAMLGGVALNGMLAGGNGIGNLVDGVSSLMSGVASSINPGNGSGLLDQFTSAFNVPSQFSDAGGGTGVADYIGQSSDAMCGATGYANLVYTGPPLFADASDPNFWQDEEQTVQQQEYQNTIDQESNPYLNQLQQAQAQAQGNDHMLHLLQEAAKLEHHLSAQHQHSIQNNAVQHTQTAEQHHAHALHLQEQQLRLDRLRMEAAYLQSQQQQHVSGNFHGTNHGRPSAHPGPQPAGPRPVNTVHQQGEAGVHGVHGGVVGNTAPSHVAVGGSSNGQHHGSQMSFSSQQLAGGPAQPSHQPQSYAHSPPTTPAQYTSATYPHSPPPGGQYSPTAVNVSSGPHYISSSFDPLSTAPPALQYSQYGPTQVTLQSAPSHQRHSSVAQAGQFLQEAIAVGTMGLRIANLASGTVDLFQSSDS